MTHPLTKNIWVVIPGLNESRYLASVLSAVRKRGLQVLYVDDGSRDNSVKLAKQYTSHVLEHIVNLGKGAALKTGCEYAFGALNAEAVIMMDADSQHDPAQLPHFVSRLQQGASLVFGIRDQAKMPVLRSLYNRAVSVAILLFFGKYIPDIPSGYKAFSKAAYQTIQWQATGYEVEMEIAARAAKAQLPFQTLPIATIYHDFGKGMTMLDVLSSFSQIISWRVKL